MNELIETERAYVEELLCVLEVKTKLLWILADLLHFMDALMFSLPEASGSSVKHCGHYIFPFSYFHRGSNT